MYEIDSSAPVVCRGTIRVAAPAAKVWSLLSEIDAGLRGAFKQILEKSVVAGLAAIKEAAEKRERA